MSQRHAQPQPGDDLPRAEYLIQIPDVFQDDRAHRGLREKFTPPLGDAADEIERLPETQRREGVLELSCPAQERPYNLIPLLIGERLRCLSRRRQDPDRRGGAEYVAVVKAVQRQWLEYQGGSGKGVHK